MTFWEAQSSLSVLQWIARAGVTFFWLLFLTRLMGQRQIGRLTLFDFVIAITIGSVASGALNSPRSSLVSIFITISTLAVIDIIVAYLALKFSKLRRVVQGEPRILIQNGKIDKGSLKKTRINLDDLLMGLRRNKVPNIADVEFAILEPNGKMSVIPKSQSRPVKPKDLKINTNYEGYPVTVIEDGNIIEDNLEKNNLTKYWLKGELEKMGVEDESEVMAAILDTQGRLYISKE